MNLEGFNSLRCFKYYHLMCNHHYIGNELKCYGNVCFYNAESQTAHINPDMISAYLCQLCTEKSKWILNKYKEPKCIKCDRYLNKLTMISFVIMYNDKEDLDDIMICPQCMCHEINQKN